MCVIDLFHLSGVCLYIEMDRFGVNCASQMSNRHMHILKYFFL